MTFFDKPKNYIADSKGCKEQDSVWAWVMDSLVSWQAPHILESLDLQFGEVKTHISFVVGTVTRNNVM